MRVNLGTIDVDDHTRRALNSFYGRPGLATRETVRNFLVGHADADLTAVVAEYDDHLAAQNEKEH